MSDVSSPPSVSSSSSSVPPTSVPTDLNRSTSTPPDLDNLSSTNVFAFGLHSSYGAFATEPNAQNNNANNNNNTQNQQQTQQQQQAGGGVNINTNTAVANDALNAGMPPSNTAANLSALNNMQLNMNMMHMGMMPMPGMDSSHTQADDVNKNTLLSALQQQQQQQQQQSQQQQQQPWGGGTNLDFNQLTQQLNNPLLFNNQFLLSQSQPPQQQHSHQPQHNNGSLTTSPNAFSSPASTAELDPSTPLPALLTPPDFNPYFYLNPNLSPMGLPGMPPLMSGPLNNHQAQFMSLPGNMNGGGMDLNALSGLGMGGSLNTPGTPGLGPSPLNYMTANNNPASTHNPAIPQHHPNHPQHQHPNMGNSRASVNPSICKFYAAGHCSRGEQCNYAHVRVDGTTGGMNMMGQPGQSGNGFGMQSQLSMRGMKGGRGGRGGGDFRMGQRADGLNQRGGRGGIPNNQAPMMPMPGFNRNPRLPLPDDPQQQQQHQQYVANMMNLNAMNMKSYSPSGAANHHHPLDAPHPHHHHHANALSPLSPSLVGLNPMTDPNTLLNMSGLSPNLTTMNSLHNLPNMNMNMNPLDFLSPYNTLPSPAMMPALPPEMYPPMNEIPHSTGHLGVGLTATAEDLVSRIYTLVKDQYGCRLLQRLLDENRPGVLEVVYSEMYPHINELMVGEFSNYACQKLIDHCNEVQRLAILEKVSPDLVAISLNLHGTRAVQKMVESMSTPAETDMLVNALRTNVVTLIKDLNGNHVIQRCLHHLSSRDNQFIYDAVCRHCVSVSTHKHGCCVLQRCIDYATVIQKRQIITEICNNALELVQDAYGNYVVQYVLDLGDPNSINAIVNNLCGHISSLAVQKFSSNVIEKCVVAGSKVTDSLGFARPIEEMREGCEVMSYDDNQQGMLVATRSALLERGKRPVVCVTLEDGRTLYCTEDHKVLTSDRTWMRVSDMVNKETKVCVSVDGIEDIYNPAEESGYVLSLFGTPLSLGYGTERQLALAWMRLAGAWIGQQLCPDSSHTGCHRYRESSPIHPAHTSVLSSSWTSGLVVSHCHDRYCVVHDMQLIGMDEPIVTQLSNGDWLIDIVSLKPTLQQIVTQISSSTDLPNALQREFVAAFFGACGDLHIHHASVAFTAFALSFSVLVHRSHALPLVTFIHHMLPRFGVQKSEIIQSTTTMPDIYICFIPASFNSETQSSPLLSFASNIGCRYHTQISHQLTAVTSYLHHLIYTDKSSPSLSSYSFSNASSFQVYCDRIGCAKWFHPNHTYDAFSTATLPLLHLTVDSIHSPSSPLLLPSSLSSSAPCSSQLVYDLTIDHAHSFVCNGIVVHNCLELSNDKLRARIIDELITIERLPRLLQDPYANYVIQKALQVSKQKQLDKLVAVIKPHLHQLRNTAFGKRIQNKIMKKFPDLDMNDFYREGIMMENAIQQQQQQQQATQQQQQQQQSQQSQQQVQAQQIPAAVGIGGLNNGFDGDATVPVSASSSVLFNPSNPSVSISPPSTSRQHSIPIGPPMNVASGVPTANNGSGNQQDLSIKSLSDSLAALSLPTGNNSSSINPYFQSFAEANNNGSLANTSTGTVGNADVLLGNSNSSSNNITSTNNPSSLFSP